MSFYLHQRPQRWAASEEDLERDDWPSQRDVQDGERCMRRITRATSSETETEQFFIFNIMQDKERDKEREGVAPQDQPELKSRADFLKYWREITLDPNTAHDLIVLSEENRRATLLRQNQDCSEHLDRFTDFYQVLSRECVTGRCYWEVEWSGYGVSIAVSYKNIQRKGRSDDCVFGHNANSWTLDCDNVNGFSCWFNKVRARVSGPIGSRIGVYLDHSAGVLAFYDIQGQTVRLLHRVQTTFTQPLYAGVWFNWDYKDSVHFPQL